MSARDRVHGLLARSVDAVRADAQAAVEADQSVLHGVRFLVELPTVVGHCLRVLSYLLAAIVMESIRTGDDVVFDESYDVTMRLSWLGPAWEHDRQTVLEFRLAAVFCIVFGVVFYETLAYFSLTELERALLWATCGTVVVEPAYVRLYVSRASSLPSERVVSRVTGWPFW